MLFRTPNRIYILTQMGICPYIKIFAIEKSIPSDDMLPYIFVFAIKIKILGVNDR